MIFNRFKYKNWSKPHPSSFLEYINTPCHRGLRIVNWFYQKVLRINDGVPYMIHFTSKATGKINVGKNTSISLAVSHSCYFQGINGITIGENTIIAPGVKIISANHSKNNLQHHEKMPPVKIGSNCWLGAGCIILPGVELGDGTIVGAGAVVTKSFPEGNCTIVGNPGNKII